MLAFLQHEPGVDRVYAALVGGAGTSIVNLAEVYTKVVANGRLVGAVIGRLQRLGLTVIPFTEQDALLTANLVLETQPLGLSLADRACLATALRLGLPVLTGDRPWTSLQIGVEIELIRP